MGSTTTGQVVLGCIAEQAEQAMRSEGSVPLPPWLRFLPPGFCLACCSLSQPQKSKENRLLIPYYQTPSRNCVSRDREEGPFKASDTSKRTYIQTPRIDIWNPRARERQEDSWFSLASQPSQSGSSGFHKRPCLKRVMWRMTGEDAQCLPLAVESI